MGFHHHKIEGKQKDTCFLACSGGLESEVQRVTSFALAHFTKVIASTIAQVINRRYVPPLRTTRPLTLESKSFSHRHHGETRRKAYSRLRAVQRPRLGPGAAAEDVRWQGDGLDPEGPVGTAVHELREAFAQVQVPRKPGGRSQGLSQRRVAHAERRRQWASRRLCGNGRFAVYE